jgi:Arc/MetJ-type ribon-helix-helix transcriptional regulator
MHVGIIFGMSNTQQIAVRVTVRQLEMLDWLVVEGSYENRAEVVRVAIEEMARSAKRAETARKDIEAYTRFPDTEEEMARAYAAAVASIEEEPWEKWW